MLPLGRNEVPGRINKVEGRVQPSGLVFAPVPYRAHSPHLIRYLGSDS